MQELEENKMRTDADSLRAIIELLKDGTRAPDGTLGATAEYWARRTQQKLYAMLYEQRREYSKQRTCYSDLDWNVARGKPEMISED